MSWRPGVIREVAQLFGETRAGEAQKPRVGGPNGAAFL